MTLKEMGFSLENEIPRMEDELEELNEEREEIKRRAATAQEQDDNDQMKYLKKRWNEIESDRAVVKEKINRFGEYVEEWESTRFVVRELTFGESQEIKDIVSSESFDVDVELQEIEGTPLQGVYRGEVLMRSVEEMPADAPDNPNDLPEILGDWLLDKCESINSVGDESVGNMSLEEAINSEN